MLGRIRALEERSGLRIGNVFHAGDGNLHPLICYDEQIPGQGELAEKVASEILMYCIEAGGSITGEHGVGADKSASMAKMFSDADLDTMQLLRCAFDPASICNPGKVFPTPRMCGEVPGPVSSASGRAGGVGGDGCRFADLPICQSAICEWCVSSEPPGPRPGLSTPAGSNCCFTAFISARPSPMGPHTSTCVRQLG